MSIFDRLAGSLADSIEKLAPGSEAVAALRRLILEKNRPVMMKLDPTSDPGEKAREHFISKTSKCLMILTAGIALTVMVFIKEAGEETEIPGSLPRNESGEGSYEHTLDLYADGKEYKNVAIHVSDKQYTDEELQSMLPAFHKALEEAFIGDNSDASDISSPVDPVVGLDGYPFEVEWEYSIRTAIDPGGNIRIEPDPGGTLLEVTALITYADLRERYIFPVMLVPKADSDTDLKTAVCEKLKEEDVRSRFEDTLKLPAEYKGIKLSWSEPKKNSAVILLLMSFAIPILLFFAGDHDLTKKMKEREEEMLLDYPDIISKMVLYIGAGMTVRSAWKKTALQNSSLSDHHAYKEMLVTVRELERGIGEAEAYRHFAGRCGIKQYVKFASLLEQNLKLGASGFLMSLRQEAARAEEERKAAVKRRGEEAGTKLLLPMMLDLGIVMAVIIVPAFTGI